MLKTRILATLRYFELQGTPLTLLDLHKYLLNDPEVIKQYLDSNWEILPNFTNAPNIGFVSSGEILSCIKELCVDEISETNGFYTLKGRETTAKHWLSNYLFGLKREQLITKYLFGLKFIPFVQGVAVLGSQAFGLYKKESDIDLLILTHQKHMWLTRLLSAAYFQIIFKRRHGKYIANRFCLNHFVVSDIVLDKDLNLYTASEYLKMRPLVQIAGALNFQKKNSAWINFIFPNIKLPIPTVLDKKFGVQIILEKWFSGKLGEFLEQYAKKLQYARINTGEFIMATDAELSFHPNNRKKELFENFFKFQK